VSSGKFALSGGNDTRLSILALIVASAILLSSLVVVQSLTENNVRDALLQQQTIRQTENTNGLARTIDSDIHSAIKSLELLAAEPELQKGQLSGTTVASLLDDTHQEINTFAPIRGIALLDENNIIVDTSIEDARSRLIGLDRSDEKYVTETKRTMQPYISPAFTSALDEYVIAITMPIIDKQDGEYLGMVVMTFSVVQFFESLSNFPPSSVIAFDREGKYIAVTVPEFLGQDFFGEYVQRRIRANTQLNTLYSTVLSGKPSSTLFVSPVTNDERFVTVVPVFYNAEQIMSVALTTPTASLYAQVDDILFLQRLQSIGLLAAIIGAISVFILYQSRSNRNLEGKVKQRTQELQAANEQLRQHDRLQREFINIAAHELRTPVQPLLGIANILEKSLGTGDKIEISREEVRMLIRNAERLERLSSDILEVSRIEGGALKLYKEPVDMIEKIKHVVSDSQSYVTQNKKVEIIFEDSAGAWH
jgi:signal transduction histidine kinase